MENEHIVKVAPQIMEKKRTVHGGRTSGSPYGLLPYTIYKVRLQTELKT